jgi:hypothetical protein
LEKIKLECVPYAWVKITLQYDNAAVFQNVSARFSWIPAEKVEWHFGRVCDIPRRRTIILNNERFLFSCLYRILSEAELDKHLTAIAEKD